ncbi:hypothetical protein F4801DRAFT_578005 [Xylaria longipes]|nr:hypothetical protein F4801DRAFT_578005 [Xylaria longipes]
MQEPWTCPAKYDIVRTRTTEIQQQKRSGSDLVVLNTEFSPASLQLWEFAIVEKSFHDNLMVAPRGLEAFPLRLELLFPIFFPRHDLIGLNHRALEDALQTRLLALAFDELCKSREERNENWRPEHLAPVTQTSIMDFYQREKDLPLDPHLSQLDT